MFCKECGNKLKDTDKFCAKCGTKVTPISNDVQNNSTSNAVKQLQQGNGDAFKELYALTFPYVYSRAKYMLHNEQDAADLTQDIYMVVFQNIDSLKNPDSLYGWLKTIIFRQGMRYLEKNNKTVLLSTESEKLFDSIKDDSAEIEADFVDKQDVQIIKDCINSLSEEQRLVILAYYYDDMKVNEIATALNTSDGTIKSRLFLARKNLKNLIAEQEKKLGYKLHSFGAVTLVFALGAMISNNTESSVKSMQHLLPSICNQISAENIIDTSTEVSNLDNALSAGHAIANSSTPATIGTVAKASAFATKKIIVGVVCAGVVAAVAGTSIATIHKNNEVAPVAENITSENVPENNEQSNEELIIDTDKINIGDNKNIEATNIIQTYWGDFLQYFKYLYENELVNDESTLDSQYETLIRNSMSHMFDYGNGAELFYTVIDLANDGCPELFISDGTEICGAYSIQEATGEIMELIPTGGAYLGDRARCYICANNYVRLESSGGATYNSIAYLQLLPHADKMSVIEEIINDNGDCYFVQNELIEEYGVEYYDSVRIADSSIEEYSAMQNKYEAKNNIQWNPLSEFTKNLKGDIAFIGLKDEYVTTTGTGLTEGCDIKIKSIADNVIHMELCPFGDEENIEIDAVIINENTAQYEDVLFTWHSMMYMEISGQLDELDTILHDEYVASHYAFIP